MRPPTILGFLIDFFFLRVTTFIFHRLFLSLRRRKVFRAIQELLRHFHFQREEPNMAGATAAVNNENLSPTLNTSQMSRYDKEIIEDSFALGLDYISYRLRNKFEQSKLGGLPRQFLIPQTPTSTSSSTLRKLATIMEAEHPDLFESLCTTLGITPVSAHPTFVGVAQEIFQAGTNWGRIVSLFTFGGVVAHHFVETQRPEMVQHILEWIVSFIADNLLTWIRENGGWVSLILVFFYKIVLVWYF